MSEPDDKARAATKLLFGEKDPPKAPTEMHRQGVHLTPSGTSTRLDLTPQGRAYLQDLSKMKAAADRQKAAIAKVPRVPPKAKTQERIIQTDVSKNRGKVSGKDNNNELEH